MIAVVVSWQQAAVLGCSAKNHPHLMKKQSGLFSFSSDQERSEKVCSKQRKVMMKSDKHYSSCHLVDVHLTAFLAPSASFCVLPSSVSTNSVEDTSDCGRVNLVKTSELGLDLVMGLSSPATAQVNKPV